MSQSPSVSSARDDAPLSLRQRLLRCLALIRKEGRQVWRDPSSIAIGVVMPLLLLILFGYGVSLDVKDIHVAVVVEDSSPEAQSLVSAFDLSSYFKPRRVHTMGEATALLLDNKVRAVVRIPTDFARDLRGTGTQVQAIVNGIDSNTARLTLAYVEGAVNTWLTREASDGKVWASSPVQVKSRMWYNDTNESRHFLVPGLIVLVMTLIGALLTAMVVAREWERGTFEALFVTPVRPVEVLIGKTVPYFVLGMVGLTLSVVGSRVLFGVPFRGSVAVLVGVSTLYLLVALGLGLVISSAVKSQFVASQMTIILTFLPAVMLSGFIFDPRSMPLAVHAVSYIVPARYFVAVLQTVFLVGDVWSVILPNAAMLAVMAVLLMSVAARLMRKKIG